MRYYSKEIIAYCIEEVAGNYRTAADVSRETGVGEQTIGIWLSRHWLGSRSFEDIEVRQSIINNDDNIENQ